MNELINSNAKNQTMSSREIAELVESRHDVVKLSIERLAERGVISLPPLVEVKVQRERREEMISVYQIGKRDSYIIVAQLSPEFTAKLVDRWQELESSQTIDPMKALSDPATMRVLLLSYTEKVLTLESKVDELSPKAEALDRIATADGSLCITDSAKELQVRPKDLTAWLQANQWIYKRAGGASWVGYQNHIQCGNLEHKSRIVPDADGNDRIRDQVRITAKGLSKLASVMQKVAA